MAFRLLPRRATGILQSRSPLSAAATALTGGGLGRTGDFAGQIGRRGLFSRVVDGTPRRWLSNRTRCWLIRGSLIAMWVVSIKAYEKWHVDLLILRRKAEWAKFKCELMERFVRDAEEIREKSVAKNGI